ncbi:MAG: hypothetical protein GXZ10_13515 [Gammaproteobacteria bacterium]|nr:hypothetical protein [Gammaproteobacteria bacterium]
MKGSDMNEINDEVKLTLNLMQTDIDDGAHGELQNHLYSLLEMKRNELQQRLVERSWLGPALGVDKAKPLTSDELMAGGWWCADTSEACRLALESFGFKFFSCIWDSEFEACFADNLKYAIGRGPEIHATSKLKLKQIYRDGNEFYWGEK